MLQDPHCASDTLSKTVDPIVINPIITGPDTVCSSSYNSYAANYVGGDNYEWSVQPSTYGSIASGNGTGNVSVLWNNVTNHTAWLIVKVTRCNLSQLDSQLVFIKDVPTFVLHPSDDTVCRGTPVTFTLSPTLSSFTSIAWDFGDGNTASTGASQSHTYTTLVMGNYSPQPSVVIIDPNGCIGKAQADTVVTVIPAPVANLTTPNARFQCPSISANLYATVQSGYGSTDSFFWYLNGSLVLSCPSCSSYTASSPGTYYCEVKNTNGCRTATNSITFTIDCGSGGGSGTGSPCIVSPTPTVAVTASNSSCGHITLHGTYTSGGSSPFYDYPTQVISYTNSSGTGYYDGDYVFDLARCL